MAKAQKDEEKFEAVLAKKKRKVANSNRQVAGSGSRQPSYQAGSGSLPLRQVTTGRPQMMLGPCFACHEYGHLRSTCPKLGVSRSSMHPLGSDESDINEVGYDYSNMRDSDNYDNYGTGESLSVSESYSIEEECLEGLIELTCVKGRLRECYEYWSNVLHDGS